MCPWWVLLSPPFTPGPRPASGVSFAPFSFAPLLAGQVGGLVRPCCRVPHHRLGDCVCWFFYTVNLRSGRAFSAVRISGVQSVMRMQAGVRCRRPCVQTSSGWAWLCSADWCWPVLVLALAGWPLTGGIGFVPVVTGGDQVLHLCSTFVCVSCSASQCHCSSSRVRTAQDSDSVPVVHLLWPCCLCSIAAQPRHHRSGKTSTWTQISACFCT